MSLKKQKQKNNLTKIDNAFKKGMDIFNNSPLRPRVSKRKPSK